MRARWSAQRPAIAAALLAALLAAPPPRGSGLILWLAPALAVLVGILILQGFLRRNLSGRRPPPTPPTAAEAEEVRRQLQSLD